MLIKHRKAFLSTLAASVIGIVAVACSSSDDTFEVTQGTVIRNATVVNTRDGSLAAAQTVVIDGGKIRKVAPNEYVRIGGTAQVVDASGKYVVPGFVDMHTHSMVHIDESPNYFPLMIANGVTSFREMGELNPANFPNILQRGRQLNADIAAGKVDAPDVLLIPSDIYQNVTSATTAVQSVDQQKALGVDFIKVISANRDAMLAFLSESKKQGTHVAGHLTPAVSATESAQAGWKTIEHLGSGAGILLDCAGDEAAIRAAVVGAAGSNAPAFPTDAANTQRIVDTYSSAKCQTLSNVFMQNGTWHVPTLRRVHALDMTDDPAFVNDPNLIYVSKSRLATWASLRAAYLARPAEARAALQRLYALKLSVVKLMKQAGVKMMAGSDAGTISVWTIPGFGLHEDFHELAAAGLSPLEILQMTTLNPAEFVGRQSTMGTVDEGKNADLVLLDANPIADAANLDKIAAVFLKGKYFPKAALDKLKSDTAAGYAAQAAPSGATVARIVASEANHVD